jgi:uncharacterized membrane protein
LAIVLFQVNITGGVSAAIAKAGARALWVLPGLAIVALAGFSGLQRVLLGRDPVVAFPLFLMAVAFYLLVGVEMFHVVDPFGNRMNTVFKVYYQVWLLLALVGAYGLYYWYAHPKEAVRPAAELPDAAWLEKRRALRLGWHAWTAATAVLLLASLYYPVGAVLDRTGLLEQGHSFSDNTLDGLDFLNSNSRGEYVAIQWLRDQAPWGRIVEAVGDDYSEYGRISASTGLPTVLGWKGHELQWRGGTRLLDGREEDIATIYRSEDGEEVGRLLERYEVRYVYLGRRERASYGGRHLADFDGILRTVFQQDGVIIYELVRGSGQGVPGDDERGPG